MVSIVSGDKVAEHAAKGVPGKTEARRRPISSQALRKSVSPQFLIPWACEVNPLKEIQPKVTSRVEPLMRCRDLQVALRVAFRGGEVRYEPVRNGSPL